MAEEQNRSARNSVVAAAVGGDAALNSDSCSRPAARAIAASGEAVDCDSDSKTVDTGVDCSASVAVAVGCDESVNQIDRLLAAVVGCDDAKLLSK